MAQNTKEIKKRIKSVTNTKKITKTMEMVATSKSKKAQDRVQSSQPFNHKIREIISNLMAQQATSNNPLLQKREEVKKTMIFVVTANRGLCGGYNSNIQRMLRDLYRQKVAEGKDVKVEIVGKKGLSYCRFNQIPISKSHLDIDDKISYEEFVKIPDTMLTQFVNNEIDELLVVYTKYISAANQVATTDRLLPFTVSTNVQPVNQGDLNTIANYIYEPDASVLLDEIIPYAFKMNFFQFLLESFTAEHIYRRIAMKSATDAATDMIKQLTLSYNRARQAKITQEIAEIIGGVNALAG